MRLVDIQIVNDGGTLHLVRLSTTSIPVMGGPTEFL